VQFCNFRVARRYRHIIDLATFAWVARSGTLSLGVPPHPLLSAILRFSPQSSLLTRSPLFAPGLPTMTTSDLPPVKPSLRGFGGDVMNLFRGTNGDRPHSVLHFSSLC